jgi:tRNA (mo5U34)-methyltransferase
MYGEDVRRRVEALRWYHTIDLGQGIVTRGVDDTPLRLARLDLPLSFAGRTVLDVGAWDGFFSFDAERRGASRVVATDHYSWHGLGWGTSDGKAGFKLAREVLGSHVEDVDLDVMELSPERVGTFDVVLFLGVLYHLRHPLLALERIASVTGPFDTGNVVDMVGFAGRPWRSIQPGTGRRSDELVGPNEPACIGMPQSCGFQAVRR